MQILINRGPGKGQIIPLAAPRTTVGRSSQSDIALLGDWRASRRHAEIVRRGSSWAIIDIGSTNGTLINGRPISGPTLLHNGDTILIGDSELIAIAVPGDATASSATLRRLPQRHIAFWWTIFSLLLVLIIMLIAGFIAYQFGWI